MPVPSPTELADLTVAGFSERLASSEPVPGGGSASAVAGSFAAALAAMVARLSADRPRYAEHTATHDRALAAAEAARAQLLELADADALAYGALAAANRLPRATAEEQAGRARATQAAARDATLVPLETLRICRTVAELVEALAGRSNVNAASDLDVAAHLVEAAAAGAAANVRINLPSLGDAPEAARIERQVADLEAAVRRDVAGAHAATMGGPRAAEPAG